MILQIIFILLCFAFDGIIATLFPASFIPFDNVFVPCFGLASLVLGKRQMNSVDSFFIFMIFGLLYDFFIADMFPIYTCIYVFLCLINMQWQKHIAESTFESTLLVIANIFVKEYAVFLFMTLSHQSNMTFLNWMVNRMFLTLTIHAVCVIILVYVSKFVVDLMKQRDLRIRKEESVPGWKLFRKN